MARHLMRAAAVLTVMVTSAGVPSAQSTTGPGGHWEGAIKVPGQELNIAIDLKDDGKKWQGAIEIPSQNLKGFPLADVTVEGDTVTFGMKGIPGNPSFKGTLSKDGKTLSGDFTQGGGTMPFSLTRTGEARFEPLPKSTALSADLQGSWEGTLDVPGTPLRLMFKLSNGADGTGTGTIVSLDQGGAEIPFTSVTQTGTHVTLLASAIGGKYEGDLKDGQLTGTWTQGPGNFPLVLKRTK